jgi:hypothetical protein
MPARIALAVVAALLGGACVDSDVSRVIGARCDVKEECDERCLAPTQEFPDGFCTLSCASDADCPDRSRCVDTQGGVCLFGCRIEEGCAFLGDGWACRMTRTVPPGSEVLVCRGQ